MLDVPVFPAEQVRVYIDNSMMVCNTNPAWIQYNGHWVAIYFTKEGGYFFDSFGRSPSYFGFEYFNTVLRGCTMTLSCNHHSPMHVDITHFVCRE